MKFKNKGMLAPFTVLTSLITGSVFPLLGSLIALDLGIVKSFYIEGVILVILGGFLAQWLLAHSIHDYYHFEKDKRITLPKKTLKILFILSLLFLLIIAIYLSIERGWPVFVFAIIGGITCLYAEGLFHHESQMAFGAMFLVIGSFYVQVATLDFDVLTWIKVLSFSLFAFFSQYGWLLIYRLDDYGFDENKKNYGILITKIALLFLVIYFLL